MSNFAGWTKSIGMVLGLGVAGGLLAYGVTEEVPIGGFDGKVQMKENGRNLPGALVTLEPIYKGEDIDAPIRIRRTETDEQGAFRLGNVVAGDYLLTISGTAHEMVREPVKVREGKGQPGTFKLEPKAPYLDVYVSQHVYTPNEKPGFQVNGFYDKGDLVLTAYKLDMQKVLAAGNLGAALSPLSRSSYSNTKPKDPLTMGVEAKKWTQPIKKDVEGVFTEKVEAPALEEGLYWLKVKGGGMVAGSWLMVTRISLVTKHKGPDAIAFVSDIETGKPIQGASIASFSNVATALGTTAADGSLRFKLTDKTLFASVGKSQALVDHYFGSEQEDQLRIVTYTDRPIYRPGDSVEFKGIVRKNLGRDYVVPTSTPVTVELRNEDEDPIGSLRLTTNAMGTYAGRFQISKEAGPGYYSLVSKIGESEGRQGVSVAAYRKPTYTITVNPEKPSYVRGDRVRMKVKAEYYFGGPVPNAKVEASVYRSEFFDPSVYGEDYAEAWGEEGGGYGGEFVAEQSDLKTDENGETWVEFETKPTKDDPAESDFMYSVNVNIADEGGKYYEGAGSVKVLRGDFTLGIDTQRWVVTPGTSFEATIRAAGPDGKPVPGVSVDLESGIEFWNGKDMEFLKPDRQTVKLDEKGEGKVSLTASRAGSFSVKASSRDNRGNVIGTSQYIWADGSVDPNAFRPTKLEVVLDKKRYRAGETARAVIQCGSPGGSALVTIEADKLYEARVVALDKPSVSIDLPVTAEHAPNVFVDVSYVREKTFSQTEKPLRVDDPQRKLKIEITPDKTNYHPGDLATYAIQTSSEDGKPTSAEVSLAVVDESIYALAQDRTDLMSEFYPRRYNSVETQYSFPDLYLDGDKAPTSIQIRRKFKDTAFWAPQVTTDPAGKASVTVELPDNLTTWRATAYGVTSRTEVGSASVKVVANRELMVRLEAPAFMVGEDRQRVAAVVTNQTGGDANVSIELAAEGVAVEGELKQSLSVPKGDTKSVEFTVSPQRAGEAVLTAKAWIDGGANDGVEARIPVLPHGRTVRERYAGSSSAATSILVTKRNGADPNVGALTVTVAPTLAPALAQSLDELIDFPYGCVEQTMSRFLPAVVVSQAMKTGGFPAPKRAVELPRIVADGLARLYRMQHGSGAWGWWEYDGDDLFMTAYVLDGLRRASQAGFNVDERRIKRAAEWAVKKLAEPLPRIEPVTSKWEKEYQDESRRRMVLDRAYLAYVLASNGHGAAAKAWFAAHPPSTGPLVAAYAALSAQAMGGDPAPAVASLASQAVVSGAVASWKESYWGVETTGKCFEALMRTSPQHPLVEKVARWLMEKRRGHIWYSTRDTTFALLGLSRYVAMTRELAQSGQIQVKLNGQAVGTFEGAASESKITIPIGNLTAGENKVEFVPIGLKRLYYAAELKQVDVAKDISPAPAEGLSIERRYYKLTTHRFEDGSMKFAPGKDPVVSADPGDLIQVQLTLKSDRPREYLLIEDPLPAGCRVTEREDVDSPDDWGWWWNKIQIFDDRVAIFASFMPTGEKTISYTVRVENPGVSNALPTSVSGMYDPDAVASSSSIKLEIGKR